MEPLTKEEIQTVLYLLKARDGVISLTLCENMLLSTNKVQKLRAESDMIKSAAIKLNYLLGSL